MQVLERYVVLLYDRMSSCLTVDLARKQLFPRKSIRFYSIPPTRELPETEMQCRKNEVTRNWLVHAVNFPVICSPLASRVNVVDYVHLEGLELAANFNNTESIDVLIGSDYHWIRVRLQSTANLDGCCPDQCTINHLAVLFPPT